MQRILVVQVAALGHRFLVDNNDGLSLAGLQFKSLQSIFPAVTCSVQSTMRTAALPSEHGMVGNGFYHRDLSKPMFWEQSSQLCQGERIWDSFRKSRKRVGQLFIQQSLGTDTDILVSPAPIHKHHGGMIQDCYSRPSGLYSKIVKKIGRPFKLGWYWGPVASVKSSQWIVDATVEVMQSESPDLLFTYLPHLDYELQRSGPDSEESGRAFAQLKLLLNKLLDEARDVGYKILVYSDYAISNVSRPVFPNRLLRRAGLFQTRKIRKMQYPDFYSSRAFAVVDHQIAHIVINDPSAIDAVRELFSATEGIAEVLGDDEKKQCGIDHPRSGDLVIVSDSDAWFAYPWWEEKSEAPEYATHIDIHNKPGYDPCELFFGFPPPFAVSTDATKIHGSHGRIGAGTDTVWAMDSDLGMSGEPADLRELAAALRELLSKQGLDKK
jgi:predicted AlkP superfamily pyrophosphatase or phosphodiesterase